MNILDPVRLPGECWVALQGLIQGDTASRADLETLHMLHLADAHGSPTQLALDVCHGYREALSVSRFTIGEERGVREASCWFARDGVALLEVTNDDRVTLRRFEPGAAMLAIASILSLGPRPLPNPSISTEVETQALFSLVGPDHRMEGIEKLGRQLGGLLPGIRDALTEGRWRCWFMDAYVFDTDPPRLRGTTSVLDTEAGAYGADISAISSTLVPLTMSDVWLRLSEILGPAA